METAARGQDPVKVAPELYKVALENKRVRVLETNIKPGDKTPTHSHPAYIALALDKDCKVRFTQPDGNTHEAEFKAGEMAWRDPETHGVENIGTTECHVLNIELKEPGKKAK